MRTYLVCALIALLSATGVARAEDSSHRVARVLIGSAAIAAGIAIAATSSETTTVRTAAGTSETSTFSKSQLITGLAIAGTGGIVLWNGVRARSQTPPITLGLSTSVHRTALVIRRNW
jgi:uncharacterized membrane protein